MDFPPESVELLSLDNRIEMVKFNFELFILYFLINKIINFSGRNGDRVIASFC